MTTNTTQTPTISSRSSSSTLSPRYLTIYSGQGTVWPEKAGNDITSTSTSTDLATQLIIWGMVAFILVELLAIICLLRFCCRARYVRKKKFKEREIILSDQLDTVSPATITNKQFFTTNGVNDGVMKLQQSHTSLMLGQPPTSSRSGVFSPIVTTTTTQLANGAMGDDVKKLYSNAVRQQRQDSSRVIGNYPQTQSCHVIQNTSRTASPPPHLSSVLPLSSNCYPVQSSPPLIPRPPSASYAFERATTSDDSRFQHQVKFSTFGNPNARLPTSSRAAGVYGPDSMINNMRPASTSIVNTLSTPYRVSYANPADRMCQELSSEDIYTMQLGSTNLEPSLPPPPSRPPNRMKNPSTTYTAYYTNSSNSITTHIDPVTGKLMNRVGFEIVSHADVRPATPIRYEQAEEMTTSAMPAKNVTSVSSHYSPVTTSCICTSVPVDVKKPPEFKYHLSAREEPRLTSETATQHPASSRLVHQHHFHQETPEYRIVDDYSAKLETAGRRCRRQESHKQRRSRTQPVVNLQFGDEKAFRVASTTPSTDDVQDVEWEMARELRTINWDRLREMATRNATAEASRNKCNADTTSICSNASSTTCHHHQQDEWVHMQHKSFRRSKSSPIEYNTSRLNDYELMDKFKQQQDQAPIDYNVIYNYCSNSNCSKGDTAVTSNETLLRHSIPRLNFDSDNEDETESNRLASNYYRAEFRSHDVDNGSTNHYDRIDYDTGCHRGSGLTTSIHVTSPENQHYDAHESCKKSQTYDELIGSTSNYFRPKNVSVVDVRYDSGIAVSNANLAHHHSPKATYKSIISINNNNENVIRPIFHEEEFRSLNEINMAHEDTIDPYRTLDSNYCQHQPNGGSRQMSEMINEIRQLNTARLRQINDRLESKLYDKDESATAITLSKRQKINEINQMLNSSSNINPNLLY